MAALRGCSNDRASWRHFVVAQIMRNAMLASSVAILGQASVRIKSPRANAEQCGKGHPMEGVLFFEGGLLSKLLEFMTIFCIAPDRRVSVDREWLLASLHRSRAVPGSGHGPGDLAECGMNLQEGDGLLTVSPPELIPGGVPLRDWRHPAVQRRVPRLPQQPSLRRPPTPRVPRRFRL